jgi:hypothetical protein
MKLFQAEVVEKNAHFIANYFLENLAVYEIT